MIPPTTARKRPITRYAPKPTPRVFFICSLDTTLVLSITLVPLLFLNREMPHCTREMIPAPIITPCAMYCRERWSVYTKPSPNKLVTKVKACPNTEKEKPFTFRTPITREPTASAAMAPKSPNQETPRRSMGSPAIFPTQPRPIPTRSRTAFLPFSMTAMMESAAATPGGHAPSAGNISDPKQL